jgi:hypothetical protein
LIRIEFAAIVVAVLLYFFAARRRYDLFTLAAVSAVVYFIPGLWGVDLRGIPLEPDVYIVMVGVLGSLVVYTLAFDRRLPRRPATQSATSQWLLRLHAIIAIGVFSYVLITQGVADTFGMSAGRNFPGWLFIAWRVSASTFVVLAFVHRSKWLWLGAPMAIALYAAADRTGLAMMALAVAAIWLSTTNRRTVWAHVIRLSPIIVAFGFLMLFGDLMFVAIRLLVAGASFDAVASFVVTRMDWNAAIRYSEPFGTQMVLNEIIRQSFYVGPSHLVGILYQIWPAPSMFGYKSGIFNELFQKTLFPETRSATANWGLAHNYWGEGLASGRWPMYFIFLMIYLGGLSLFNRMTHSRVAGIKALGALMGAYWAFYIHRNSLGNIITFERHILYLAAACALVAILLSSNRRFRRRVRPPANAPGYSFQQSASSPAMRHF